MRKRLSILIALLAAVMIAVATVIPATAGSVHPLGSNGQQVEAYENTYDVGSVCLSGYNQLGTYVYACFSTPAPQHGFDQLAGYWWVGTVYLDSYAYPNVTGYLGETQCTVPLSYPIDYFTCSTI